MRPSETRAEEYRDRSQKMLAILTRNTEVPAVIVIL